MPKQTNCWISLGLNARSPNVKKAACFLTQVITSQGGMMEPNPPPLVDTTAEDWPPSRSVLFRFIGGESSNKNQADELWLRVIGADSISFGSPGYLWEPFISSATIPIWLSRIYAWSHGPRVWTLNLPPEKCGQIPNKMQQGFSYFGQKDVRKWISGSATITITVPPIIVKKQTVFEVHLWTPIWTPKNEYIDWSVKCGPFFKVKNHPCSSHFPQKVLSPARFVGNESGGSVRHAIISALSPKTWKGTRNAPRSGNQAPVAIFQRS